MTIKGKIVGGFLVLAFLFFTFSFFVLMNFIKMDNQYSELIERRSFVLSSVLEARVANAVQGAAVRNYILTGDEFSKENYITQSKVVDQKLQGIYELVDTEEQRIMIEKALEANKPLLEVSNRIIEQADTLGTENISEEDLKALANTARGIRSAIADLITDQKEMLKSTSEGTSEYIREVSLIFGVASVILFIIFFITAFSFSQKRIVKPLHLLGKEAEKIANFELSDINSDLLKGKDEIAVLGNHFNKMKLNLLEMVKKLDERSEKVFQTSEELSVGSTETKESANQVAEAIQEIAIGASKQTDSILQILRKAEHSVQEVSKGIEQSNNTLTASKETTTSAHEGNEAIKEAIKELTMITNVVSEATKTVQELGKRSEEIGGIITTISNISEQTNLLALNAAIEAARAGEAGKGFAVVAEEVRKLAEDTNISAQQISSLINDIQGNTTKTVKGMEESYQLVKNQVDIIEKGGKCLRSIVTKSEQTENNSIKLNEILQELQQNLENMKNSVQEISGVVTETSAAAEEVSATTEEQVAIVSQISSGASSLEKLSKELKEEIDRFKF